MFNFPIKFCVAVNVVTEVLINVSNLKAAANASNIKFLYRCWNQMIQCFITQCSLQNWGRIPCNCEISSNIIFCTGTCQTVSGTTSIWFHHAKDDLLWFVYGLTLLSNSALLFKHVCDARKYQDCEDNFQTSTYFHYKWCRSSRNDARGAVSPPEHKDAMTCWGQSPFWPQTEGVKDGKQLQVVTKKEIADCKIISSVHHHN